MRGDVRIRFLNLEDMIQELNQFLITQTACPIIYLARCLIEIRNCDKLENRNKKETLILENSYKIWNECMDFAMNSRFRNPTNIPNISPDTRELKEITKQHKPLGDVPTASRQLFKRKELGPKADEKYKFTDDDLAFLDAIAKKQE